MWKEEEKNISMELIVRTFNADLREVSRKWIEKIEQKDILELDETRIKLDFMILRSKLDFINTLGIISDIELLMTTLDELEENLKDNMKDVILGIFMDKVIATLKNPLSYK